ncbi:MAG: hypothetical protein OEO82_01940 [Gammaproteobacteria bacterium]|nr:hypothetical protein [Gammaproteobacteria bacterium]
MIEKPLIIYIPGLLPKPEPQVHRDALLRCLLAGLRRIDARVAREVAANEHCFDLISWTFDFYGEYRDFALDAAAVAAVVAQPAALPTDIDESTSWRRRFARWMFGLGDLIPFLIPHIASERMQLHLRDLRRYTQNHNEIAEHTRQMLKIALRAAGEAQRPVLLLAHSMGSVIAYEALWQMSHSHQDKMGIDLLLTMGSPLGQRYIQRRVQGCDELGAARYPHNIRRWINLSAVGDLTAIDPTLADDFAAMIKLDLIESIVDRELHNYFRSNGELNVHAEYGYLVNAVTAQIVSSWWQSVTTKAPTV